MTFRRADYLPRHRDTMEDESAVTSTYELSNVSQASRRPSRGAGDGLRPFGLATPFAPFTPMEGTGLETPPLTPGEEGKFALAEEDKFAPFPQVSLPPTPTESADPFASDPENDGEADRAAPSHLHPVDTGYHAWMFLASGTLIEAVIWGLPYSVGVFHEYWASSLFGHEAESTLTLAATLNTGLLFMSGAIMGPMFAAWPWYERYFQIGGLVIAASGLVASAFVTQPWQLLVTFGIMYPCSAATYLPCATNVFEWFHARRGMATGIMYSGTGAGGMIYPFVVQALLRKFGYKATMISLAVSFVLLNSFGLVWCKRRVPLVTRSIGQKPRRVRPKADWSFMKRRDAWVAMIYLTISCLGNFIPLLWMPTYAATVGIRNPDGAGLVSIMNGMSMAGNLLSGFISDLIPAHYATIVYSFIATISVLCLWGFGTTGGILAAFAVVWGITGGAMAGFWARLISVIARDDPAVPQIMVSIFISLKGIGAFVAGPISTALLKIGPFHGAAGAYGSTDFGALMIFTAFMTFVGALALFFFDSEGLA